MSFFHYSTLLLAYTLLMSCSGPSISIQNKETKEQHTTNEVLYTCDNGRYEKDIFPHLKETRNIKYHSGKTMQNMMVNLHMDIFEPEADPLPLRPLVIWAHGGYFVFGDKADFHDLCAFVSHKGWVSASIDYRKWRKRELPDSLQYMETALRATHDLHAAIRFFKEDAAGANKYRIDTNKIFVGGYSAGGIMAAQVAYLDYVDEVPPHFQQLLKKNGGLTGKENSPTPKVAGTIVIAGALYDKHMIQKGYQPPFLGIQGTKDDVVPYARGWAYSPMGTKVIKLDGTASMHRFNQSLELPSTLLSLPRGDHNAPWDNLWQERTLDYIHKFLVENTCPKE